MHARMDTCTHTCMHACTRTCTHVDTHAHTLCSWFANKHQAIMSPDQLDQYDCIINLPSNNWDIYYWITGKDEVSEEYDNDACTHTCTHCLDSQ